jgi:hypothetical protein
VVYGEFLIDAGKTGKQPYEPEIGKRHEPKIGREKQQETYITQGKEK